MKDDFRKQKSFLNMEFTWEHLSFSGPSSALEKFQVGRIAYPIMLMKPQRRLPGFTLCGVHSLERFPLNTVLWMQELHDLKLSTFKIVNINRRESI